MEIFKHLPTALQLKVLNHMKNPVCDHLLAHWRKKEYFKRRDLLVSLNRYNYFVKHRKRFWDRCLDDDGLTIAFDFTPDEDLNYKEFLNAGKWLPSGESLQGMRLRTTLFNVLEEEWWQYHGTAANPRLLALTIYDPLQTKRIIEAEFDTTVRGDTIGHPTFSFDEWTKRCGEGAELSIKHRRKLKAPRLASTRTWNFIIAQKNIERKAEENQRLLLKRTWGRWRRKCVDGNVHEYFEIKNWL